MKRDRAAVDRRGDGHDLVATVRRRVREKPPIERLADAATAGAGMDANEVAIRLPGIALRSERGEKPGDAVGVFGDEGPRPEMREEQPRQHRRHGTSTPPSVELADDAVVVRTLRRPNGETHEGGYRSSPPSNAFDAWLKRAGTLVTTIWKP